MEIRTDDPLPGLVASLTDKRRLLLLDNCEHVIDAAASLAAAVLSGAPSVSMLATSRELLGVSGEREYRLGPLSSPQSSYNLTATEAATFPAVQLFVERVTATVEDFALIDASARWSSRFAGGLTACRWRSSSPHLASRCLASKGLAARMNDSLLPLQGRRRTALPRHRIMRAVIDWSYGLLSEDEQLFFRALGIFSGGFTVEAAAAVSMDAARTQVFQCSSWAALDGVIATASKSESLCDAIGLRLSA